MGYWTAPSAHGEGSDSQARAQKEAGNRKQDQAAECRVGM